MADIQCYWNLKSHIWDVEEIVQPSLLSQIMYRCSGEDGRAIGFHCKKEEVVEFTNTLKSSQIKAKRQEIENLSKEIEALERIQYPKLR